jgi:hypothetical protein
MKNLRDDHGQRQEVHAHGVGDRVIQDINILTKAIRYATKRRRVEEGHWGAKHTGNGSVEHRLASSSTEDRYSPGEQEHEQSLTESKSSIRANVCALVVAEFV